MKEVLKTKLKEAIKFQDLFHYWPSFYDRYPPEGCSEALRAENKNKNHTTYAYPFDHNLIKTTSNYINASPMHFSNHKYIAAEGPRKHTFSDFWEMVWQEGSELIVSVTNERENEHGAFYYKFDAFWPNGTYGCLDVRCLEERQLKSWNDGRSEEIWLRKMEVESNETKRTIYQLHMQNWWDGDVILPSSLVALSEAVDAWKGQGSIVVHCAAGIGRTGTLIAFHSLYHDMLAFLKGHASEFDVPARVEEMRRLRYGPMVAERMQFALVVQALASVLDET